MHDKQNEIILYQSNNSVEIEVKLEHETVWLTQAQIALLFGVKQPAISKHLKNIFLNGELDELSVYSILEYTANDGKKYKYQSKTANQPLSFSPSILYSQNQSLSTASNLLSFLAVIQLFATIPVVDNTHRQSEYRISNIE